MAQEETLDNVTLKYTEANMFEFALDYFEKFCKEYAENRILDIIKVDKFLSKNLKRFGND